MTQNYIYQGRNYISSKRASEISDYASDYIGQLCRAGKLVCQRVGRAWFITEESLRAHMTNVWSDDALRNRASNLTKRFIKDQPKSPSANVSVLVSEKKTITSKQAALLTGYAPDYIGQLCRGGKIEATLVGKTWMVVEESLKAHIEKLKEEQLKSQQESLRKKEVSLKRTVSSPAGLAPRSPSPSLSPKVVSVRLPSSSTIHHASFQLFMKRSALTFATLAILVIGGSVALVRFTGVQNSAVRQPLVASVYNTATSINDFVTGRGLAVAPRTGSVNSDAAMQTAIRDSFSDQVNVSPDQSGTAGVITPVFKKTNGKDFMYVMVPVKDATTTMNATR